MALPPRVFKTTQIELKADKNVDEAEEFVHHITLTAKKEKKRRKNKKVCTKRRRRKCSMRQKNGKEKRHCRYYIEIICKCRGEGKKGRVVIQDDRWIGIY